MVNRVNVVALSVLKELTVRKGIISSGILINYCLQLTAVRGTLYHRFKAYSAL